MKTLADWRWPCESDVAGLRCADALGQALVELRPAIPELFVLDPTCRPAQPRPRLAKAYPHRFFNIGVAEANMADIAAGMATAGLRPVINTFSLFLALKCTDQIRNTICYNNLPVVLPEHTAACRIPTMGPATRPSWISACCERFRTWW